MRRIAFVLTTGHQAMTFATMSVFEFANRMSGAPQYEVFVLSEHGGPVASSLGVRVETLPFGDPAFDTVIVGGDPEVGRVTPALVDFLRRAHGASRRLASTCTGAFSLAAAGLLDDRRATTHWRHARRLQLLYPKVRVQEDRIYIVDDGVWTSAGMTAGLDLALAMVEADLGAELAREVARSLVVYHRRAGGQSQYSTLLDLEAKSDRIQDALHFARRNLASPLTVPDLAAAARLSARQFSRAFISETGQTPAKAVEKLRVEAARAMMEDGRLSVEEIAREAGFADRNRMRRSFLRAFGHPPMAIRRNAREGRIG
ncbi:MAG: AraC family transcriptional regulator [Hyphomicrobiales bacterium]|nr:AraC family transcriptional regulator [Hyphomicrobiales bacterium]